MEINFKGGIFDFSYSLLKNAADLGIIVDGKNYVAYPSGDESEGLRTLLCQNKTMLKQQQIIDKMKHTLTTDGIIFV